MTKEKIAALIAAKIAGQGSAVDVGGALPVILNGITDLIPDGGGSGVSLATITGRPYNGMDEAGLENIGITHELIESVANGTAIGLFIPESEGEPEYLPVEYAGMLENSNSKNVLIFRDENVRYIVTEDTEELTMLCKVEKIVKPLEILSLPTAEMTAQQLRNIGFTYGSISAFAAGDYSGLVIGASPTVAFVPATAQDSGMGASIVFELGDYKYFVYAGNPSDNPTVYCNVTQVSGGGSIGSLCYELDTLVTQGNSQLLEDTYGQIFTDFINSDYADESYPKFILCEDGEGNKYLIPFRISVDIDGYGSLVFEHQNKTYRVFRNVNDEDELVYRIVSSNVPGYVGPIALDEEPNSDWANITTTAGLAAVGITDSEVSQASRGLRTGLTFLDNNDANVFLPFESVTHDEAGSFGLSFRYATSRYSISYDEGTDEVTVSITSV